MTKIVMLAEKLSKLKEKFIALLIPEEHIFKWKNINAEYVLDTYNDLVAKLIDMIEKEQLPYIVVTDENDEYYFISSYIKNRSLSGTLQAKEKKMMDENGIMLATSDILSGTKLNRCFYLTETPEFNKHGLNHFKEIDQILKNMKGTEE